MTATGAPGRPRRRLVLTVVGAAAAVVGIVWIYDFFPPSLDTLEERSEDQPGVSSVSAIEPDGDGLPFARNANEISVVVERDATASQIEDVLHAYEDDVDDGDVGSISVQLSGTGIYLLVVEGTDVSDTAIEDVVDAGTDERVLGLDREDRDDGTPYVYLELAPSPMSVLVDYADRYDDGGAADLTIGAGDFSLRRPGGDEAALALAGRRERLVVELERRFRLTGADVSGSGPLVIRTADAAERRRVRAAVVEPADVGRVVVR